MRNSRYFSSLILAAACSVTTGSLAQAQDLRIQPDLVYGHKDGLALTLDVITPPKPGGAAVMFIVSGGWYSMWVEPKQVVPVLKPLLDKGFTVLVVRHGSAPKYAVPDAVADVRLCTRFVRMKASELGIDPSRIGVIGGSAGGHLALMLATTGDDGDAKSADPLLKQSSRVRAIVSYFPPTDLRGFVKSPPKAVADIPALRPPLTFDEALEDDVSPVVHSSKDDAPALLIHGDQDQLVPIAHSQNMVAAAEKSGAVVKLLTIEGAGHGYNAKHNETVIPAMVGWFEEHLAPGR